MRMFPDDASAEAWIASIRWPDGPRCPHCDSDNVLSGAAHKTMPYRCRAKECRKRFSVRVGTALQDSKLGYRTWALAAYLMTTALEGRSLMKLHRDLGITRKSAWRLAHRIRGAWDTVQGAYVGPVEVDETYVGGREKTKHASERLNAGRGTAGESAVMGARDRRSRELAAGVAPKRAADTLAGLVEERRVPDAPVYTDGATAYDGPTPSESTVAQAIKQAVAGYKRVFGARLAQVWLFGSRAVGEHRPDSDVDLLVVLRTEGSLLADLNLLYSVAKPLRRTSGVFVDAHPTTVQALAVDDDDFNHFVRLEGRRVDV